MMTLLKRAGAAIFLICGFGSPSFAATESSPVQNVKIVDSSESISPQVILDGGVNKLAVLATTVVEQVFGQDPNATTYFFFGNTLADANGIGNSGDTVRTQIPAAVSPLNTLYPAVDVTTTVTPACVADSRPERCVALDHCDDLNNNANFTAAQWRCDVIKDFGAVHISSKLFNEWGQRTTWTVTCSGTTICNEAEADINRRGKPTELSRSPNDLRQGVLAIQGSVTTIPTAIGDKFSSYLLNGGSSNMLVDGSVTPVDFEVVADTGGITAKTRLIENIRCFGGGSNIKFGQFLSKSGGPLTNGILISLISAGETFTFEPIKSSESWKNIFSTVPGTDFRLDIQSGSDQFIAQFRPPIPFQLEPNSSDKVQAQVRDNLTSGIQQLECYVFGFEIEQ